MLSFASKFLAQWSISLVLIATYVSCQQHETVADSNGLSKTELYERICKGEHVDLLSISQVKRLANEARENKNIECPSKVTREIEALGNLLSISEDNVCTNAKADALQEFTWQFLRGKFEQNELLSKPLESFFVNYGMRIGEKCRQRMIDLIMKSKSFLNEQDLDEMEKWAGKRSAMSMIFSQKKSYENLVLPKTLAKSVGSDASPIYILLSTSRKIQHFQAFCERRLKPIYEPLIEPQMKLSSIGFNLLGTGIANQPKLVKDYTLQWYRLVFLCESLGNIVLVDEQPNQLLDQRDFSEASATKLIKVYTKDELAKKRDYKIRPISIDAKSATVSPDIKIITEYNPTGLEPVVLEDRVHCGLDVCLTKAIKKYMDNLEYKRRNKFLSNLAEPMAHELANGSLKLASRAFEVRHFESFIEFIDKFESMSHDSEQQNNDGNQMNQADRHQEPAPQTTESDNGPLRWLDWLSQFWL